MPTLFLSTVSLLKSVLLNLAIGEFDGPLFTSFGSDQIETDAQNGLLSILFSQYPAYVLKAYQSLRHVTGESKRHLLLQPANNMTRASGQKVGDPVGSTKKDYNQRNTTKTQSDFHPIFSSFFKSSGFEDGSTHLTGTSPRDSISTTDSSLSPQDRENSWDRIDVDHRSSSATTSLLSPLKPRLDKSDWQHRVLMPPPVMEPAGTIQQSLLLHDSKSLFNTTFRDDQSKEPIQGYSPLWLSSSLLDSYHLSSFSPVIKNVLPFMVRTVMTVRRRISPPCFRRP